MIKWAVLIDQMDLNLEIREESLDEKPFYLAI